MEQEIDLRQYLSILRRRWYLIVGCTLLAAIATFVISSWMQPVYQATATLLVQQAPTVGVSEYTAILTSERLAQTYVQMLTARPILEMAIARMRSPETPEGLAKKVKVERVRDAQLIRVKVEDTDPVWAASIANILAEVFIEQVQSLRSQRYVDSLNSLKAQIDELSVTIAETQRKLETQALDTTPQGQAERTRLETILAGYRNTYAILVQSYEQMRLAAAQSGDDVILLEKSKVPEEPVRPRKLLNTALAGVLGMMLAVGAAFVIEYLDDTLKNPDDINRTLDLPTLATIGRLRKGQDELIMTADPLSPVSEAFRVLRTNIHYSSVDRPLRVLLVTSPSPMEGKSLVAANLAVALAQGGLRTALVDADLRRPRQYRIFGVHHREGLVDALLVGSIDGRMQPTAVERLSLLPTRETPPNPVELLGSRRMQELREELCRAFDVVVVDSPPALLGADAAVLARIADGVLLVVEAGKTRRDAARQAVKSLQQVGARLIGVVLNRVPTRRDGYYGYYYYGYYEEGRPKARSRWWWSRAG